LLQERSDLVEKKAKAFGKKKRPPPPAVKN
jgi:hypothetical protein